MTKIKVEKKKPVWPWILLILIILGILVYLFVYDDYNEEVDDLYDDDQIEEIETSFNNKNLNPLLVIQKEV